MSELSSINENDTPLDILCDNTMDMENVAVIKSSGKCFTATVCVLFAVA